MSAPENSSRQIRRAYDEVHSSLAESFKLARRWAGSGPVTLIAPSTSAVTASPWLEHAGVPIGTSGNRHSRFSARPRGTVIAWCLHLDEILDIEHVRDLDTMVLVRAFDRCVTVRIAGVGTVTTMVRVLDIDLDFFVTPPVHWPPDWERPVEQRRDPRTGGQGLNEGNFLLFAMACRWISDLVYVFGEGGGDDEIGYILPDRKRPASELQLLGVGSHGIDLLLNGQEPDVLHREPSVPYRSMRWEKFAAVGRYDFICLTRSPRYTPNTADPLFDMLCDEFVDASVDV